MNEEKPRSPDAPTSATPSSAAMPKKDIKAYLLIGGVIAALGVGFAYFAGVFPSQKITAQKFVNLQEGGSPHAQFRRAHAKGVCITGQFVSNGALSKFSKAEVFKTGTIPIYGRFSIGAGNPTTPDLDSPVRSLALIFDNGANQQWRMAMNTPPVMAVRTPEDFYQQLTALSPDPKTGAPNPQAIAKFFKDHPESAAFIKWKDGYKPTNSFSTEIYNSINAFYLVDADGKKRAVRWAAVPQAVPQYEIPADAGKDILQKDLANKLKNGSVNFDLVFSFAEEGDLVDDPTIPWPGTRLKISAGTIRIQAVQIQAVQTGKGGACEGVTFDPLTLPSGIEPSNDPILRARSAAYAESYRRRARETLLESK